jgi:ferrous iron transport protein B
MITDSIISVPLITLVGPPNAGKTTLFNLLSGKNHKTVNYPGATVEYAISKIHAKYNLKAEILDSPGIISLIPSSPDERVAIEALFSHPEIGMPDLIVATVDSTQLSRHLLLVEQLLQAGFNVIVALTMTDMLHKRGMDISAALLEEELNCPVAKINGRTGSGSRELIALIERRLNSHQGVPAPLSFEKSMQIDMLINSYRDIERIEKKVLYELPVKPDSFNLTEANKKLVLLNQPKSSIDNLRLDRTTVQIDNILLHKVWGFLFFFLIMSLTFTSIFWFAEPLMNLVDKGFSELADFAQSFLGHNVIGDLISSGIISGTGSVMVFLPQIIILFLILGLLEDTGYLARGAMLVDRPLSKIGLNGRSFVPMLSGFACAIPAILAARTIPNKKERLLTVFIIPLMSCSARLPVYTLLIAFLILPGKLWLGGILLAAIYIFSIFSSIITASLINKLKNRIITEEDNSSFILELPSYRMPKLSIVLYNTYSSAKVYLKRAGPVILFFSLSIWFLTYFPNYNPVVESEGLSQNQIVQLQNAERLAGSYAADLGKFIQPVMTPIGMDWRVGVSLIAAFAAREVFVSSLALIFKVTSDDEKLQESILAAMRTATIEDTGKKLFTTSTIIGLIVFFVFALQCLSTIAVSRKETGGWRIPVLQLVIFTSAAYIFTFITVNGLRFLGLD